MEKEAGKDVRFGRGGVVVGSIKETRRENGPEELESVTMRETETGAKKGWGSDDTGGANEVGRSGWLPQ